MEGFFNALTWALVHSLWQGLIAALLAAIIISATRKTSARLRYNLLGIVFISSLVAVLVTFISYYSDVTPVLEPTGTVYGAVFHEAPVQNSFITGFTAWLNDNSSLLLLVWSCFFFVNCLKLVTGLAAVNRLRNYKIHPAGDEWKMKLEQLQVSLNIRRRIKLFKSELVKVPVAIGFLKPVILVPIGFFSHIPVEQVEAILLHELSHIKRRDYLVNFLQRLAEAIFFFNPAFTWISSLLRQEREACCDEMVVERTGEKRTYLNALVSFEEYSLAHNSYAMGFSTRKQYLLNRVKRIVTNENKRLNLFEKLALVAGVVMFSAFTYLSTEKETVGASLITNEQVPVLNASTVSSSNIPVIESQELLRGRGKINIVRNKMLLPDTIPVKKKNPVSPVADTSKGKLPAKADWETATILQEMQQIKDKIGVKKESIGAKKEQLKNVVKDSEQEKKLLQQIKSERDEVEKQREQLENKRKQLNAVRVQKKDVNQKIDIKKEEKYEAKFEKKNELKNEQKNELKERINRKIKEENKRIENKNLNNKKVEDKRAENIKKENKRIEDKKLLDKIDNKRTEDIRKKNQRIEDKRTGAQGGNNLFKNRDREPIFKKDDPALARKIETKIGTIKKPANPPLEINKVEFKRVSFPSKEWEIKADPMHFKPSPPIAPGAEIEKPAPPASKGAPAKQVKL